MRDANIVYTALCCAVKFAQGTLLPDAASTVCLCIGTEQQPLWMHLQMLSVTTLLLLVTCLQTCWLSHPSTLKR